MRATRSILVLSTLGCLATAIAGCGDDIAAKPDDQGQVTFDLTLAPTDARCAVVTITPAMGTAVVRQFPLSPSQTAVFALTGLPTGDVTIGEQVFTVACAMTAGAAPTWIADPVMVTLQAGTPVSITFNLRRVSDGGQVMVSTNFPQPPGTFQEFTVSAPGAPLDRLLIITTGPDDNLWFTNATGNSIGRISTGGALTLFPVPTANSFPTGIAAGADGNLWFTEQATDKIGRITTSGTITEFALAMGSAPLVIAAGPDGALWFCEAGTNKIGRITTGGTLTEINIPTANANSQGLAVGPDRNIWFSELSGNKIGRITLASGTITEFNLPTALAGPLGLVAGPDGNVWFAEGAGNRIGRITTGGAVAEFVVPTPGSRPPFVTVGPDNAIWFTEQGANQIGRVTTAGVFSEFGIPTADSVPVGITTGPDGRVWFTEQGVGKVGAFRP